MQDVGMVQDEAQTTATIDRTGEDRSQMAEIRKAMTATPRPLSTSEQVAFRMECLRLAHALVPNAPINPEDLVKKAKTLAKWVITGKTGNEEE